MKQITILFLFLFLFLVFSISSSLARRHTESPDELDNSTPPSLAAPGFNVSVSTMSSARHTQINQWIQKSSKKNHSKLVFDPLIRLETNKGGVSTAVAKKLFLFSKLEF
jgi:hypothetical protein